MNTPSLNIDFVVVLPHLRVRNANAVSSPLTWGFPPPSAFTGFAHAIERRLHAVGHAVRLVGTGIVSHRFEPQVSKPGGWRPGVFCLTRNPHDKEGNPSAIVEEGRAHLELSLVLAIRCDAFVDEVTRDEIAESIQQLALGMRLAGGSVMPSGDHQEVICVAWPDAEDQPQAWRKLRKRLLPGFVLVGREALLKTHLTSMRATDPKVNTLDALLDLCRLNMEPQSPKPSAEAASEPDTGKVEWRNRRPARGWLVPLPVGYAAISELYEPGAVKGARDQSVPFRFVESVLTLGEWINPLRLLSIEQALWWHDAQPDAGLYRLGNGYTPRHASTTDTPG